MHLIPSYKPLSKTKPTYVTRRKYTDENCEALQASLDITLWDNLLDETCIDKQTDVISDYINFCSDLCIPKKTFKKHANQKPWITKYIDGLIDQKQDAHQSGNKKLYHKLKKLVTKEITKSKVEYSKRIQQHLINEPARAWKDIKKLNGLPTSTSTTDQEIKFKPDDLNTFFARYEKPEINKPNIDETKMTAPPFEVKEETVLKQLKTLNTRKGAGPDGLIPKVLRICAYQLAPIITRLFNKSIEQQTTPKLWKSAVIKPLPKVSTPAQLKDYRPIAITSCLCKMLERQLKIYITEHTAMDRHQFAYRQKRSTQDAVLCLTTTITNFIDKAASNYARCLFLDFSSAFNTIRVEYLIPLLQHLDSRVTGWVTSFLSNRVQQTMVNNQLSAPILTHTGTPQGSVLSPLLFSLYTNRITSNLSNITVLKYADDTCVIGLVGNDLDLCNYFSEINRISKQCMDLDLLLNASKTKEMLFSTQRLKPDSPQLILDGTEILFCEKVKYLGIDIDHKLRFEDYVQRITGKASQRMYVVKNFLYLSSKPLACMLFKSFVVSLLMYCLPVLFTSIYARDKKSLRKVFQDAKNLGLEVGDLDTIVRQRTKSIILCCFSDEDHFIHDFLERCPSGRLRHVKYRSSWGKDYFLRQMCIMLNEILF